uniref:Putative secreted protein n=1 Tax=Ixodes ricinus TaxID=34613 RepID=A0A6B0U5R1_IXORI
MIYFWLSHSSFSFLLMMHDCIATVCQRTSVVAECQTREQQCEPRKFSALPLYCTNRRNNVELQCYCDMSAQVAFLF